MNDDTVDGIDPKTLALMRAFQKVFGMEGNRSHEQMLVMAKLQTFCRAFQSTYSDNEREHCEREGRREVYLLIDDCVRHKTYTVSELLGTDGVTLQEESTDEFAT